MSSGRQVVFFVVAGALVALARTGSAQPAGDPPVISPDRPDFSNGIQIVPVGHLQVEGGVTLSRTGGSTDVTAGELVVRLPLSTRVEVRMQLFTFDWTSAKESSRGTLGPLVDLKWKVFDSEATDFGFVLGTTLPVATRGYREPHFQPYGVFSLDQAISEKVSVTANAGVARASVSGETFGQLFGGLSFAFQASQNVGLFLEGFGWDRTEPAGPGEQLIDGGLQYLVGSRLMLDGRVGVAFGRKAPDDFVGLGAAFLF